MSKKIVLIGNASHYLFHFRSNLITKFLDEGYSVTCLSPKDEYTEKLCELGANYIPITFSRWGVNPFLELIVFWKIFFKLKKIRPDFVLTFTIKPNIYIGIMCLFSNWKYIPNITGLGTVFSGKVNALNLILRSLYIYALKSAATIIVQNDEDKNIFKKIYPNKSISIIRGSGVNLNLFKPNARKKNSTYRFIFVGRLVLEKGLEELIEAVKILNSQLTKNYFVYIIGNVDHGTSQVNIVKDLINCAPKNIIFCGHIENPIKFYQRVDCFVLPSYREGFSKSMSEALASGLPMVVSNVPGLKDGFCANGQLCHSKSSISLSIAMKKMLILTETERNIMSKKSRIFAEENLGVDMIASLYFETIS